jgi:phosphoribosylanthranilate isomerase
MMVKICGITNLEDAQAAVEAGAAALGFNFYPKSPRYISPEATAAITARLPAGVVKVGVFVDEAPEVVLDIVRRAGLAVAQLHGHETGDAVPAGVRVWKAFRVTPDFDFAQLDAYEVEAFLLDAFDPGAPGGTGRTWNWRPSSLGDRRIVLAGGLDERNVGEAIRRVRPWGVDACSRIESAPGRKDHARMAAFIRAALAEAS